MTSPLSVRQLAEDRYHRALDHLAAGEAAAAVQEFRESLAVDPTFFDALHGLIRALQDSGDYDDAIAAAQDLIARDPDSALAHTSLSILYQHKGMVAEAEAEALKAKLLGWKLELREARATSPAE
jgi:tetratricopeptide (TPR) repeat protein